MRDEDISHPEMVAACGFTPEQIAKIRAIKKGNREPRKNKESIYVPKKLTEMSTSQKILYAEIVGRVKAEQELGPGGWLDFFKMKNNYPHNGGKKRREA